MSTPEPRAETQTNGNFSLDNILSENHESLEHPKYREEDKPLGGWDEEVVEKPLVEGYCVECEGNMVYSMTDPWADET